MRIAVVFSVLASFWIGSAGYAQSPAVKWIFDREIENQDKGEKPFPEYVIIDSSAKAGSLRMKLPSQEKEKVYPLALGKCRRITTFQIYKENDQPYELYENTRLCERKGRINAELWWERRDANAKWTPIAKGTYVFQPNGNVLNFTRTNTEQGSRKTINARADYRK